MTSLASSAKYLSEKGLSVTQLSDRRLLVTKDEDRSLELIEVGAGYKVQLWESVPGPREYEFSHFVPTLEQALLVTWCFYFAEPIVVAGWIIPIHRYPYWNLAGLQYRLASAGHVTAKQFESIREKRVRRAATQPAPFGPERLAFIQCTQFIVAGTRHDSMAKLLVRRDLEEAYVVTNV